MPGTDVAVCRACGSTDITLFWNSYRSTWRYKCLDCGQQTPDRRELKDLDGDVDWRPAAEVKLK